MNKNYVLVFIVILFLLNSNFSLGASTGIYDTEPTAANFDVAKSSDQDLYTGDMHLSIPLMNVPGRNGFDLPLSLSYSAGIRLEEEASWVGLGWNLGAGVITRAVNGVPDESRPDYEIPKNERGCGSFLGLSYDAEYYCNHGPFPDPALPEEKRDRGRLDSYYVSFGAGGGEMIYNDDDFDDSNLGNFYMQKFKPWNITHEDPTDGVIDYWKITTEDGTQYIFEKKVYSKTATITKYKYYKQLAYGEAGNCVVPEPTDVLFWCGDGICDGSENFQDCPEDCPPPICDRDNICEPGETQEGCPEDCGCNNNNICERSRKEYAGYCNDCNPVCGNGKCEDSNFPELRENCDNCPEDCGKKIPCIFERFYQALGGGEESSIQRSPLKSENLNEGVIEKRIILKNGGGGGPGSTYGLNTFQLPHCKSDGYPQWPMCFNRANPTLNAFYSDFAYCYNDDKSNMPRYVTAWYLTKILSNDYVDRGVTGPDDADYGNWIKIDYTDFGTDVFVTEPKISSGTLANAWSRLTPRCSSYVFTGTANPNYIDLTKPASLDVLDCEFLNGQALGTVTGTERNYGFNAYTRTLSYPQFTYINYIETPTHKAVFNKNPRNDLVNARNQVSSIARKLDNIVLYKKDNTIIKKIGFTYDYRLAIGIPGNSEGKLTLKNLKTYGKSDADSLPTYDFEYYGENINYHPYAFDWWGYYNGQTSNSNSVGDIHEANPNNDAKAWSLKKIIYPTGGSIEYDYEIDKYRYIQTTHQTEEKNGGGIRLKFITTDNGIGKRETTNYIYEDNGESTGISTLDPTKGLGRGILYAFSNIAPHAKNYVSYYKVTVVLPGNYGKKVTEFVTAKDPLSADEDMDSKDKPHSFVEWKRGQIKKETDYNKDGGLIKQTDYNWNYNTDFNFYSTITGDPNYGSRCQGIATLCSSRCVGSALHPCPIETCVYGCGVETENKCIGIHYGCNGLSNYDCDKYSTPSTCEAQGTGCDWWAGDSCSEQYTESTCIANIPPATGLPSCDWTAHDVCTGTPLKCQDLLLENQCIQEIGCNWVNDKTIYSGWPRLNSVTELLDGITTTTEYSYNPNNSLPNQVTETNTNNEKRITETAYAFEYNLDMANKNMLSQPVVINTLDANNNLKSRTNHYYHEFYPNQFYLHDQRSWLDRDNDGVFDAPPENPDIEYIITYYGYDNYGNIKSTTDPKGITTTLYYGDSGGCTDTDTSKHSLLTCVENNLHQKVKTYYNDDGTVSSIKDANNQITYFSYDGLNRLTNTTPPGESNPTTNYTYVYARDTGGISPTNLNRVQSENILNPNTNIITESYADGLGNNLKSRLENSNNDIFVKRDYNEVSLLKEESEPYFESQPTTLKTQINYYEDPLARVKETIPKGSTGEKITTTYSNAILGGNSYRNITVKDEEGNVTTSYYDKFGNLVRVVNPEPNNIINYEYDILGRLTKITNAQGQETINRYDTLGRLINTTNPDFGIINYTYDDNGNLINKTQNNVKIDYYYDNLNRLIKVDYPNTLIDTNYKYDGYAYGCTQDPNNFIGRLGSVQYNNYARCFYYDVRGRIIKEKLKIDSSWYNIEYTYDSNNNLKTIKYPNNKIASYNYNNLNQLDSVTVDNKVTSYTYNADQTIGTVTSPNSVLTTYGYTQKSWLENISTTKQGSNLFARSYNYDLVGNIKNLYGDASKTSLLATFGYDQMYRLQQVTDNNYYGTYFTYTYDLIGNRQTETKNTGATNYLYEYEQIPQTPTGSSRLKNDDVYTYYYDANGNLITKIKIGSGETTSYEYDSENRLIKITYPDATISQYVYDENGLRIKKIDPGLTTYYIRDKGGNVLYEIYQ